MDKDDFRLSALGRYHDAALGNATTLLAFSRMDRHSHHDFLAEHVDVRMVVAIMDGIHQFCFNARKAIEIAERFLPGVLDVAKSARLRGSGTFGDTDFDRICFTNKSFWWIISRSGLSL